VITNAAMSVGIKTKYGEEDSTTDPTTSNAMDTTQTKTIAS